VEGDSPSSFVFVAVHIPDHVKTPSQTKTAKPDHNPDPLLPLLTLH
jgi:hypothetical protein